MKTMYKRIFVILISVIIFIIFLLNQNKKELGSNKEIDYIQYSIKYFNEVSLNNKDRYIRYLRDRFVSIDENEIYIGNNKKEIENRYYDVYIKIDNDEIVFAINKLFKVFDKNMICNDEYLDSIIKFSIDIFNLPIDKNEVFNIIKDNYEIIRDIDRNTVDCVDKTYEKDRIKYTISVVDNMLVIKLGDK